MPPYRPSTATGPGRCDRCGQPVIWCLTAANRVLQAVDPARDLAGNTAVYRDETGRWRCRQLSRERPLPEGAEVLHQPHIASCSNPPAPKPRRPRAPRTRRGTRPTPTWRLP